MENQIPTIPRAEWERHPNFPAHVLLLGSHENFRSISQYLIEKTISDDALAGSERLFRRWIAGMRSHEAYEELKLYPYLASRWRTSLRAAAEGHDELHEAHDEVIAGFEKRSLADVMVALRKHDEVLNRHLQLEEDMVIPLLLALPPAEFRNFYEKPIEALLKDLKPS